MKREGFFPIVISDGDLFDHTAPDRSWLKSFRNTIYKMAKEESVPWQALDIRYVGEGEVAIYCSGWENRHRLKKRCDKAARIASRKHRHDLERGSIEWRMSQG